MTTAWPPLVPQWDGDPQAIVDYARQSLAMKLADPGVAVLQRLSGTAIDSARLYLGWPSVPDEGQTTVPDPVRDATVALLVELYRRKDLTFGVLGTTDPDGISYRIAADWLAGNAPNLHMYKRSWGVA
jgi:hypothetical protein